MLLKNIQPGICFRPRIICRVPAHKLPGDFFRAQKLQAVKWLIDIGRDQTQQPFKMSDQALNGGFVKQVAVVLKPSAKRRLGFRDKKGQIKFGGRVLRFQQLKMDARQFKSVHGRVLQHKHHLEKGGCAEVALRLDLFYQPFK